LRKFQRKRLGWNLGNQWKALTRREDSLLRGLRLDADIGVYSLHLKRNLVTHGNTEIETGKNIRKREVSIQQLLAHIHDVIGTLIPSIKGLVVGGDFNTNHDQAMFAAERTLDSLINAGYRSVFDGIPLEQRESHIPVVMDSLMQRLIISLLEM
jgi:hypothetical protein